MLAGLPYDPTDPTLIAERLRAQTLCHELNSSTPNEAAKRAGVLNQLFGKPVVVDITPPFFCDYGYNIDLGDNVYFNVNCVVLDVVRITIGSNTLFGPGVHIYAAPHSDCRRTIARFSSHRTRPELRSRRTITRRRTSA